jgi:hypothetical protein
MPCVGLEPTVPASERAKTVLAFDRAATVTGLIKDILGQNLSVYTRSCVIREEC